MKEKLEEVNTVRKFVFGHKENYFKREIVSIVLDVQIIKLWRHSQH